jgi:hypothetical protein
MHALANMVGALRAGEGDVGYVSALGMTATKHAVSILSRDEERGVRAGGRSSVEELTTEERTGPPLGLDDGRRTVANGEETPPVFARLLEQEGVGLRGRVIPGEGEKPNRFVLVE